MTYLGASSPMHATSVSVLLTIRTSPTPVRPSSVESSRNVSSRHGVPTTVVRASTIFIVVVRIVRAGEYKATQRDFVESGFWTSQQPRKHENTKSVQYSVSCRR